METTNGVTTMTPQEWQDMTRDIRASTGGAAWLDYLTPQDIGQAAEGAGVFSRVWLFAFTKDAAELAILCLQDWGADAGELTVSRGIFSAVLTFGHMAEIEAKRQAEAAKDYEQWEREYELSGAYDRDVDLLLGK